MYLGMTALDYTARWEYLSDSGKIILEHKADL